MPIKPENKKLYPKNWKEIRQKILKRADNKCEFCGLENYSLVERKQNKITKIVLTIAHLDHNPQNNSEENLKALCQKCHLNYDLKHHLESRKRSNNANFQLKKGMV